MRTLGIDFLAVGKVAFMDSTFTVVLSSRSAGIIRGARGRHVQSQH